MIRIFFATLAFMSRLPVPYRWSQGLEVEQYSRGIVMFPWVGMVLGTLAAAVFLLLAPWCGTPLAALFYVLALAMLTGGFHLDGLADTCDGLFSARTREKMLEIMRDSRLGTHGGLGLIFVLVAKVLVVNELALRGYSMLPVLILASVAGRSAVVLLMYRQRYARDTGLGNIFIGKIGLKQTAVTLLTGAVLCFLLLPGAGLLAWFITTLGIGLIGMSIKRTLRGQTGDTLGAAIELGEVIFLLALL
ncbi:adenosylcobinamide-GDP ribazoletransferase [Atlantibacter hermannii]|uniref:adenosylcobinamide-GDP ribazoletransferase n=1 Tax=Atlantibacter hermannii TaxID=565 RepID=UPI00289F6EFF|nr:adenosylcobinamide-GDP ribazoletransferase [Atlantibacter hermannii]MCQ4968334.1 adenosylcobinamide-GDP ribazoletransferase [Enterobacteriaceae bacterium DFI.7.85]